MNDVKRARFLVRLVLASIALGTCFFLAALAILLMEVM